ncbi:MAG: hypothetical protein DCC75_11220, partial [Proteobacteria bacterium]
SQSIEGKLLSELLERAGRANVPLISLCGLVELSKQQLEQLPEMTVFGIGRSDGTKSPQEALFCLALQVARIIS